MTLTVGDMMRKKGLWRQQRESKKELRLVGCRQKSKAATTAREKEERNREADLLGDRDKGGGSRVQVQVGSLAGGRGKEGWCHCRAAPRYAAAGRDRVGPRGACTAATWHAAHIDWF